MAEKTILGVRLRRRIITTVNGMGRGQGIRVYFRGTRAYTNGKDIVLPAIKDLAEIPYSTARALMGYAIHEVAHVRETDFESIIRAINDGRMEPDKLIKKFENAIEDYRIERVTSKAFPGSIADLTALRNRIHPPLSWLKPEWMADPRACGPLALTWTGSLLNGFVIPEVIPTLDAFPAPVRALVDNWTRRMDGVVDTDAVIDLAIVFAKEAMDYAYASREPSVSSDDDDTGEDDQDQSQADSDSDDDGNDADDTADGNDVPEIGDACDNDLGSKDAPASQNAAPADSAADESSEPSGTLPGGDGDSDHTDQGEGPEDQIDDSGANSDLNPDETSETESSSASAENNEEAEADEEDDPGVGTSQSSRDDPDNSNGAISDNDAGAEASQAGSAKPKGADHKAETGTDTSDQSASPTDTSQPNNSQSDYAGEPGDDTSGQDGADENATADNPQSADQSDSKSTNPFADVLDDNAEFDDFLDDLRDAIAQTPLPEEAPEAEDGEVDPDEIITQIEQANDAAPDYISPDPDPDAAGDEPQAARSATAHHYNDTRFVPVDQAIADESLLPQITEESAGVISTTARTIRRLLMSEEKKGTHRNRRDGTFDIRNISAIVRQTGTCYKRTWERPAPETHLTVLGDFSSSMLSGSYDANGQRLKSASALSLSVTGMFALSEATRNTSIETSIYGFAGYSPDVELYTFKEGKQASIATRRKIGNYGNLQLGCTPTGEAMAAVAELLEDVADKRRILMVITDGMADDQALCQQVIDVLERRGIEVVAIGIKDSSVLNWCPNSHVINDISQLPQALLACIDPRAGKKSLRKAA